MTAFYNERDPYAAEWLRNLIAAGHIAPGIVSEDDIRDLRPSDLNGFTQCHFFAGIGVWSHALRKAGWPDDEPIWTGSCPCQPFSAAGRRAGIADERHLWPHWFWLIDQCRPPIVLGEQVASKDGLGWLDLVSADMEGSGYAFGASDLCAAGFGGAHIRQRLYFVGVENPELSARPRQRSLGGQGLSQQAAGGFAGTGMADRLDVSGAGAGLLCGHAVERRAGSESDEPESVERAERLRDAGGLDHTAGARRIGALEGAEGNPRDETRLRLSGKGRGDGGLGFPDRTGREQGESTAAPTGHGSSAVAASGPDRPHAPMLGRNPADWLFCRDGKWRPVEPGTQPLASKIAERLVCSCPRCKTETVIYDGMRFLRSLGSGDERRRTEEVLRQGVLPAAQIGATAYEQEHWALPGESRAAPETLRAMRDSRRGSHPPQGPEPAQRQSGEPRNGVPTLPPRGAFATAPFDLRGLRDGVPSGKSQEPEQNLFCPVCERVVAHECQTQVGPPRVGRLRAYGNALDKETAENFVGCVRFILAHPLPALKAELPDQIDMFP